MRFSYPTPRAGSATKCRKPATFEKENQVNVKAFARGKLSRKGVKVSVPSHEQETRKSLCARACVNKPSGNAREIPLGASVGVSLAARSPAAEKRAISCPDTSDFATRPKDKSGCLQRAQSGRNEAVEDAEVGSPWSAERPFNQSVTRRVYACGNTREKTAARVARSLNNGRSLARQAISRHAGHRDAIVSLRNGCSCTHQRAPDPFSRN